MITRRKQLTRLGRLGGLGATSGARQTLGIASSQAQVTALAGRVAADMPMRKPA